MSTKLISCVDLQRLFFSWLFDTQMVYEWTESVLRIETYKTLCDFGTQTDHPILNRRPNLLLINKKKSNCPRVDFADPVKHRVKMNENEKIDKYLTEC